MSEDVLHRSADLTYHELRVMEIIAPRMTVSESAAPENVTMLQTLEAAEVMRCIRESGLVIGPSINGIAELTNMSITVCCVCEERAARAERNGRYFCGHCLEQELRDD